MQNLCRWKRLLLLLVTATLGACNGTGPGAAAPAESQPQPPRVVTLALEEACEPGDTLPQPTALEYLGPITAEYGDVLGLEARLSDSSGGPLATREIRFTLGSLQVSAVTDDLGMARAPLLITLAPAAVPLQVTFAGDATHTASTATATVNIVRADTRTRVLGPTLLATGTPQRVRASLADADEQAAIAGRVLVFEAAGARATATTDASGVATATLSWSEGTTGPAVLVVSFAGDTYYEPSRDEAPVTRYMPTAFAVWGGNTPGLALGDRVNFWGHSWPKQVTGGAYDAQGDFKGWAYNLQGFTLCQPTARPGGAPPLTQGCWDSKTGQSWPPDSLPEYIGVIVPNAISKDKSTLFGNVAALAVVKVDPAPPYGPVPGKPGWGTLVALVDGGTVFPQPVSLVASQRQPLSVQPGQTFDVTVDLSNPTATQARSVSVTERFEGMTPATGEQALGTLEPSTQRSATFAVTAPSVAPRGADEPQADYLARLAALDGLPLRSVGRVRYVDPTGSSPAPIDLSSVTRVQLPWLTATLSAPSCAGPCTTVRYVLTVANLGFGKAQGVSATLVLPDGTSQVLEVGALAANALVTRTVEWTVPEVEPRGANETVEAYLARLREAEGRIFLASVEVLWKDARENTYGPVGAQVSTVARLPILSAVAERPTAVLPGQALPLVFTVSNLGSVRAADARLQVEGAGAPLPPFTLEGGQSTSLTVNASAPPVAPKGVSETDGAYLARLQELDASLFSVSYSLDWASACPSRFGPLPGMVKTFTVLPVVTLGLEAPATADAGDTLQYTVSLANIGSAEARELVVSVLLPDGSTRTVAVPQGVLARGATVRLPVSFTLPATQAPGTVTAHASARWADAVANVYGPVSSSASTEVRRFNLPPVVNAGPDLTITLPAGSTLEGSVSDDGLPVGSALTSSWVQVSGPGIAVFADSTAPVTGVTFTAPGTYVVRLIGSDGELSASDEATLIVRPREGNGTTLPGGGTVPDEVLINVERDGNQLRLLNATQPFNFIWVAVSTKGTVVKIDSLTGKVLGEYWTSPNGQAKDPSRTTVDKNGSVWASNRAGNSVVHIGLVENGQCVDRNGNGVIDTSRGPNDIKAWTNLNGADTNGGVTTAADECMLHYVRVRSGGTRHVSVDANNDVWVSGTSGRHFDLVDGRTGQIKRQESSVGYGGYGGLIDREGVIWSAASMLRWDTALPLNGVNGVNWQGYSHSSYGLCLGPDGHVWNTEYGPRIRRFSPNGTLLGTFMHGGSGAQGCVVDKNGHVWVAHSLGGNTVGHLKPDGSHVGNVRVGNGPTGVAVDAAGKVWSTNYSSGTVSRIDPNAGPLGPDKVTRVGGVDFTSPYLGGALYNYSDMTGSTLGGAPDLGTWTFVRDSGVAGSEWGKVTWKGQVCGDGALTVTVASSENGQTFGTPVRVVSGEDFNVPNGRYLRVTVAFKRSSKGESPVLYELSVGTAPYVMSAQPNGTPTVDAGRDQRVTRPNPARVTGSACDDGLPAGAAATLAWSQVGGPGTATFASPNQEATDVSFSLPGTYVLRLTASDSVLSSHDDVTVTVLAANQQPVVSVQAPTFLILPGTAELIATVTDDGLPDGGTLSGGWTKVSGPGTVTFSAPSADATTAVFSQAGTYVLRFFAFDGHLMRSEDVSISVSPAPSVNQAPRVSAGPNVSRGFGAQVALAGSVTDDGLPVGKVVTQQWSKVSGPGSVSFSNPATVSTNATFSLPGVYVLRLTATDTELTRSADVSVELFPATPANRAPGVSLSAAPNGMRVSLTGTLTDDGLPSGVSLTQQWSVVSGPGPVSFSAPASTTTVADFTVTGLYVLRLTASDTQLSTHADVLLAINTPAPGNTAPTVFAGTSTATVLPADSVQLAGTVGDDGNPAGSVLRAQWTQVSGLAGVSFASPNAASTRATFPGAGTYVLRLTASDGQLERASDVSVVVHPAATANKPPVVSAGPNLATVPPDAVALQGTASDDGLPQGNALTVAWTRVSGPGTVTFEDAASPTTPARFSAAGTYVLRLTASDGQFTSTSDVSVVVNTAVPSNEAPVVDAGPSWNLRLPTRTVTLTGSVTDDGLPTGAVVTQQWTMVEGPAAVTFSAPTQKTTMVTVSRAGSYRLRLTASDTRLTGSSEVTLNVAEASLDNAPPVIDPGPNLSVNLPAPAVALNGSVTDDGRPLGNALEIRWEQASGPAPVSFANAASATTTAGFTVVGDYLVRLVASDGEWVTSAVKQVRVQPLVVNKAPSVTATGPGTATLPGTALLSGSARDDGLPASNSLAVAWSQVSGPGTVSFTRTTQVSTAASFSAPGDYVLRLSASDGELSASADVTVRAVVVNQAPVVFAGDNQVLEYPARTLTLAGSVTDDGLPSGTPVSVAWSLVAGAGTVSFGSPDQLVSTATFSYPGTYLLRLTASDSEKSASSDVTVNVGSPSGALPVVALTGPVDGTTVTSPVAVVGSVSEGLWKLEHQLGDGQDPTQPWTEFASGTAPINGTLGTFDPTLLLNGTYTVRLVATTSAGDAVATLRLVADKNLKLGAFSISFEDLTVPVSGLPIELMRTYDSRDKRMGDFGVGWQLGLRNIRLEKSAVLGRFWQQTKRTVGFFPTYCLAPSRPAFVTITFPSGKVYKFQASTSPQCQQLLPIQMGDMTFEPAGDTKGSLVPLDATDFIVSNESGIPGPASLTDFELVPINPSRFVLTTEDGTRYQIHEKLGVQAITDTNGNTLQVTRAGLIHSSGRSVLFDRDAQGRITRITDPNGNAMTYAYDARGDLREFKDREGNVTKFAYDGAHYLLSITDPRGIQPARSEYDNEGRIVRHTDAFGRSVEYARTVGTRQEVITDRLGRARVLEYDANGNVVRETDPDGKVTTRAFDARGNKTRETNALGQTWQWEYDGRDNKLSETSPLGQTERWTYDARGQVLSHTDAAGRVTRSEYDASGNPTLVTDALGNVTRATYSASGETLSETDAQGHVTRYAYDASGRMLKQTDALGRETAYTYDANGNRLTEARTYATPTGTETLVTRYEYDKQGRQTKVTHPDGTFTRTEYNSLGLRSATVDELGRIIRYTYDADSRLTLTTFPDGTTEEIGYDAEGRRASVTDRADRTTRYEYDSVGRMTRTVYADGSATATTYDASGRAIARTDALGYVTRTTYDDAGRVTSVTDASGQVTRSTYDARGNLTSVTDPLGRALLYHYDAMNRRVRTVYPDGTEQRVAYDARDRKISETDAAGRTTAFAYDAAGQLIAVTDAAGQITRFGYDGLGRLVSQTDALGRITSMAYDRRGRLIRRTLPTGESESWEYDAVGNVTRHTDLAGRTRTNTYDVVNRLIQREDSDGASVSFSYTANGLRQSYTDARGTTQYTYDSRNRLTALAYPDGRRLTYSYDARGLRTALTAHVGGGTHTTAYAYDARGGMVKVTDPQGGEHTHAFDASGQRTQRVLANGIFTHYGYDTQGRLKTLVSQRAANVLQSYAYTLGPTGHRVRIEEAGGTATTYEYDQLDRLTRESVTGTPQLSLEQTFTYDAVGNRLQRTRAFASGTNSWSYTYDTRDRLLADGASTYTWGEDGQLSSKVGADAAAYVWDRDDRLRKVTLPDGTVVEHEYDPEGVRVRTRYAPPTGPLSVTDYLVDPSSKLSHVVAETDGAGNWKAHYVRAADELLAVIRPEGSRFNLADGLGSVRYLTDESGAVTDSYRYDAFGTLLGHDGTDANPYLFAGEPLEVHSGLTYLRARWLDTATGRFVSVDPLDGINELPSTLHRYSYALQDPVNKVDPTGEMFSFSFPGFGFSFLIHMNAWAVRGTAAAGALASYRLQLLSMQVAPYRALMAQWAGKLRAQDLQIHHLVEQRLWERSPMLRQIWPHVDDIPSVVLKRADHQVFTNLWRTAFPYSNQANYNAAPKVEEIMRVAQQVYANHPIYLRAIYVELLQIPH